ncbi:hypothetical protein D3C75_683010 [compost metagenome]
MLQPHHERINPLPLRYAFLVQEQAWMLPAAERSLCPPAFGKLATSRLSPPVRRRGDVSPQGVVARHPA